MRLRLKSDLTEFPHEASHLKQDLLNLPTSLLLPSAASHFGD